MAEKTKSDSTSLSPQPKLRSSLAGEECYICCEPIKYYVLGECNHRGLCSRCALRKRVLYQDTRCPLCNAVLDKVLLTSDHQAQWSQEKLKQCKFDRDAKMYYGESDVWHYDTLHKLLLYICPVKNCNYIQPFKTIQLLKQHVKEEHHAQFCPVCLEDRKVFIIEQSVYNQKQLREHLEKGEEELHISHQMCQFCNKYFYDTDKLYDHLQKSHESCFICYRQGILYQYYKNYNSLESHFRSSHYLCGYSDCLAKRFVVFATELELQLHEGEVHSRKGGFSKLNIEFNNQTSSSQTPQSSTTNRAETPPVSSDFPSLSQSSTPSLSHNSWGAPLTRSEAFPALPGSRQTNTSIAPSSRVTQYADATTTASSSSSSSSAPASSSSWSSVARSFQFMNVSGSSAPLIPTASWGRDGVSPSAPPSSSSASSSSSALGGGEEFPSLPLQSKPSKSQRANKNVRSVWSTSSSSSSPSPDSSSSSSTSTSSNSGVSQRNGKKKKKEGQKSHVVVSYGIALTK